MATRGASVQQGIESGKLDYYDILIIGRTGMGKSTTTDKLLIAHLEGQNYLQASHVDPEVEPSGQRMKADDLTMWLISGDIKAAEKRLKNLIFCRGLESSHIEVNNVHAQSSPSTDKCELLSNETTKLRILDVPGFFGVNAGKAANRSSPGQNSTLCSVQNMAHTDLGIMRNILQIQSAMNMKFKRIVYFLPQKGPLVRGSGDLQAELCTMVHYFGESIFDCMVLAATMHASVYKSLRPGADIFDQGDIQTTKENFQEALHCVFPDKEHLPELPIVFLSMLDSCEAVFKKIDHAPVAKPVVELAFQSQLCARCGIKTKIVGGEKVACYYGPDPDQSIPYEQSTCHPLLVPKHSQLIKVLGGIAHVLTLGLFIGRWLGFTDMAEACIDCHQTPGSRGCYQIQKQYILKGEPFPVDHKDNANEPVIVVPTEAENQANYQQEQHEVEEFTVIEVEPPRSQQAYGSDIDSKG